ncbi:MFS transporter [Rhodococcus sp. BP-316]|uniref:MFS transporter n=1 Tax=Rhodococcus sp. BP-316 TaxID=2739445 RepID=UPI001C9A52B7|nr:MFS transporter [Rhodococcus sp. BP-316]MBY6683149.1 MFS transporter [Rhodococcus sp. BP-316]
MKKAYLASTIGTVIEWFDFYIYAVVASLVINKAFFSGASPAAGTLAAFATFAAGYLARPIGGIVFGWLGDRIGRKQILTVTLVLMGVASFGTGVLPTYEQIGITAPVILVILRIIQGIGVGGEYGGAVLMMAEHGHRSRFRGFLTSLTSASAAVGFLLASGTMAIIAAVTTSRQFETWGWRIPFIASIFLLVFGFWLRRNIDESPVFLATKEDDRTVRHPLLEIFRYYPRELIVSFALPIGTAATYSLVLVFAVAYGKRFGFSSGELLAMTTAAQAVYLPMLIGSGFISDLVGRRIPITVGAVGVAAWGFAFWPLLGSGSWWLAFLGFVGCFACIAGMYGPLAGFLSELFPPEVGYSGVSFGYQVSFAIAGGLTPVVAEASIGGTDNWLPVAVMMVVAGACTVAGVVLSRRLGRQNPTATSSREVRATSRK